MLIKHLALEDFRLIDRAAFELESGANVLIGGNAQGKTTILEAISYLSTGRSFRTSKDREILRFHGKDAETVMFSAVECDFVSRDVRHSLRGAITRDSKSFWADDKALPRLGDLWGLLNVVIFLPTDVELVKGGPAGRRGLMSSMLARASRADLQSMQAYAAALRQRNALLKQPRMPGAMHFEAYETQMADHGARIMMARERLIRTLSPMAQGYVRSLAEGTDLFEIDHESGCPHSRLSDDETRQEVNQLADWLRFQWNRDRDRDRERGSTVQGPHRADMALVLNGKDARSYASQGQARTIVLALRLAEMELLQSLTGERPVLLIDDVMGELDLLRARRFIHILAESGMQALVTATDATQLEQELPIRARFRVEGGEVERI